MFHSAVIKLTAWQVSALLAVCLLFSIPAYNIAMARLRRGAEIQTSFVERYQDSPPPRGLLSLLNEQREEQLSKDRHDLLISLISLNAAILLLGTIGSYLFARRTLRPIEIAHAAQSRFTSDASHELRTPLATMQTEIDVALRDPKLTLSGAKQALTSNLEDIARLHSLSEQLLYLTRMDAKDISLKPIDVTRLLRTQVKRLEKLHDISIQTNIAKALKIQANPDLLDELLAILVDNAVQYTSDKPLQIVVDATVKNKVFELRVQDNGIGIAPTDLPFIFDRFYRGSKATKQRKDGHGLGLALAKAIAQAHGGDIVAQSKLGFGTTFVLTIPLA